MATKWTTTLPTTIISLIATGGLTTIAYSDYMQIHSLPANTAQQPPPVNDLTLSPKHTETFITSSLPSLFGKPSAIQSNAAPQIPETRLNFTLKGTFTHKEGHQQSALISGNNGTTSRYFTGNEITSGTEIIDIKPGVITLRRNGQDEILTLPILSKKQKKPSTIPQQITQSSASKFLPPQKALNRLATRTTRLENERKNKLKERLEKLRSNQRKN